MILFGWGAIWFNFKTVIWKRKKKSISLLVHNNNRLQINYYDFHRWHLCKEVLYLYRYHFKGTGFSADLQGHVTLLIIITAVDGELLLLTAGVLFSSSCSQFLLAAIPSLFLRKMNIFGCFAFSCSTAIIYIIYIYNNIIIHFICVRLSYNSRTLYRKQLK